MIIQIIDEINYDSYKEFSRLLRKAEQNRVGKVTIELMSEGGSAYAALAFFDRIKSSDLSVTVVGTGIVASAATLILAAGHRRCMTKNAWVMVHEDSAADVRKHMSVSQAETELGHNRTMENQWNDLLASVTRTDAPTWDSMNKKVSYLTAAQCLELGLIEEIV